MKDMKADEANRFHEEDEDPQTVFAIFDAAEKGQTSAPGSPSDAGQPARWGRRVRHELARALRRVANAIDSSHARA
jgi:hypothetical protein